MTNRKVIKVVAIVVGSMLSLFLVFCIYVNWLFKVMDNASLIKDSEAREIPFYWSETGHMVVEVVIDNKKFPFIIDSGAGTIIFPNFLELQKAAYIGPGFAMGAGGGFIFPSIHRIDTVRITDITFCDVSAVSIEEIPTPCLDEVYGIIGKDIMRHLIWQIDFKKKIITIASKKNQLIFGSNKEIIPLEESQLSHHLYTTVKIDSSRFIKKVMIDTGNNGFLSTNFRQVDTSKLKTKQIRMIGSSMAGLDGKLEEQSVYQAVEYLQIGNVKAPNSTIHISNLPVSFLGISFLENYKTTISWKDKELILESYGNPYFGIEGFGYSDTFDETKNAVIVDGVLEGLQADSLGIQTGDVILHINGQAMDNTHKYCYFDYSGVEELTLDLMNQDGMIRQVTLERREYFPQ
ncbi:MAG: aspartyl protease family protein [Bacteroidota bacterium]